MVISQSAVERPQDFLLGASDGEYHADLLQMKDNLDAHFSSAVMERFLDQKLDTSAQEIVLRHLQRCAYCRSFAYNCLQVTGAEASHPAFSLLERAAVWERMAAAGEAATKAARAYLHEKNIGAVYRKDSVIVEEAPDGVVRPLAVVAADTKCA